jgi:ferredoxin
LSRSENSDKPEGAATAVETGAEVRHESLGGRFRAEPGRPLLDCGLEQDVDMDYGCRVGACGACAVEVVEGLEHLEEPDPIEKDALTRYELPLHVRLACRACTKGPLTLRSLDD